MPRELGEVWCVGIEGLRHTPPPTRAKAMAASIMPEAKAAPSLFSGLDMEKEKERRPTRMNVRPPTFLWERRIGMTPLGGIARREPCQIAGCMARAIFDSGPVCMMQGDPALKFTCLCNEVAKSLDLPMDFSPMPL